MNLNDIHRDHKSIRIWVESETLDLFEGKT